MPNYSGNDTKFQIGLEDVYGTAAAAATTQLEILNESLSEGHNTVESEALVGAVTTPYFSIIGRKVEGDTAIQIHPDKIGELMFAALGVEAAPTDTVEAAVVYDHVFTPAKGSTKLSGITAIVDKKADVFTYTGLKIDSFTIETDPGSLVTSTISFIGLKELLTGTINSALAASTYQPYNFNMLKVYFGDAGEEADTLVDEVINLSLNYSNNLENDLFVADGTDFMAEIDYQRRDITLDLETLYNATVNTYREDYYKTGGKFSVRLELTHSSDVPTATAGNKFALIFDMLNVVITEAPNDISGPERMRIPLSLRALEVGTDPAISVTVRDGQATKYDATAS